MFKLKYLTPPIDITDYKPRTLSKIEAVVFHRLSLNGSAGLLTTAAEIAAWFVKHGPKEINSPHMPYAFVVPPNMDTDGNIVVEQALPLNRVGPHAKNWNIRSIGVVVVGDFRTARPTETQHAACTWLVTRLQDTLNRELMITQHSVLTSGTSDPNKLTGGSAECPGKLFIKTLQAAKEQALGSRLINTGKGQ